MGALITQSLLEGAPQLKVSGLVSNYGDSVLPVQFEDLSDLT